MQEKVNTLAIGAKGIGLTVVTAGAGKGIDLFLTINPIIENIGYSITVIMQVVIGMVTVHQLINKRNKPNK